MTEQNLIKTSAGLLPMDQEAQDWFNRLKLGSVVRADYKEMRNGKFHRKFFVMLKVAHENHDWPDIQTPYGPYKCSFETFRREVTIMAGHWVVVVKTDGTLKRDAVSIKWSTMSEAEFKCLYSDVLDVILAEFLTNWTTGDMEYAVSQILQFV